MATKLGVRKCKNCKRPFQKGQPLQFVCGPKCGIEWARSQSAQKIKHPRTKAVERNKSDKRRQTELTQKAFNRLVRLLDEGKPCISCGRMQCGFQMEAGHYKSVGSHPELRFDFRNCHGQGSACNRADNTRRKNNLVVSREYETRLRERYGNAVVEWLNGPHEAKHYSLDDLVEMRKTFLAEIRHLMAGGKPTRDWRVL